MEMRVPFTSFHEESPVRGYSRRHLCHHLKFWSREHERMELVSNGTRSSLDRPFHGSFSIVVGKRKAPYVLLVSDQLRRYFYSDVF